MVNGDVDRHSVDFSKCRRRLDGFELWMDGEFSVLSPGGTATEVGGCFAMYLSSLRRSALERPSTYPPVPIHSIGLEGALPVLCKLQQAIQLRSQHRGYAIVTSTSTPQVLNFRF
jgi:hypothetical protein